MGNKKGNCFICQRIESIKKNNNPFFVMELKTGYVVLGDYQFYRGYTLFLCKKHVTELHQLPSKLASLYLSEMMIVAKAVWQAFGPEKLNYELLGNSNPHLHWHIIPRYKNDPQKDSPIWCYDPKIRIDKKRQLSPNELLVFKKKLVEQIKERLKLNNC